MTLAAIIISLACLALASWTARKALRMNAVARQYKADAESARKFGLHWQQVGRDNIADANKWRASRAARIKRDKTAAQAQRAQVIQVASKMREGG